MRDQLTRGQVRDRLTAFAARWSIRPGDEQKEEQQFLIELLQCVRGGLDREFQVGECALIGRSDANNGPRGEGLANVA